MSLEAQLVPDNLTDSASYSIDGGTSYNFIYFFIKRLEIRANVRIFV